MNTCFKNIVRTLVSVFILTNIFITSGVIFKVEASQFMIDYKSEYIIDESGEANIIHNATITNLQNDVIPMNYSLSAMDSNIYEVSAETNGKETEPKLNNNKNNTDITVTIKDYSIGEGRQNTITIKYKSKSVAVKSGSIWNIYIPKIQIPDETTAYDVKLSVPESFGPKVFLTPEPTIEKKEDGKNIFYFTKNTFESTGISAAFGGFQPVNFKIKYQIQNDSILPAIKKIAIPSDIEHYQNVSYDKISPRPFKIEYDEDNNFVAYYILKPKQKTEIEVQGTSRILSKQINVNSGGIISEIPKVLIKNYTRQQKYWETKSPYILKIARELKKDDQTVVYNAKMVYEFIKNNLKYDFDAQSKGMVERKGAEAAASQKNSWTCMEFTDLFIAVTRAMGIPAREINGYAFTSEESNKPISISLESGDTLHSWAEFYDPYNGWVQVDPTWGTTSGLDYFSKLDTNHFAFVRKGISSEHPFSAGTYRYSDNEKLIETALSQTSSDENFKPSVKANKVLNLNPLVILSGKIRIKIENTGKVTAYDINGLNILPREKRYTNIKKENDRVVFKDFMGNEFETEIEK